ncbi:hypothetical protein MKW94_006283 [Papaver nudicaule]|uniref:Calmodulin-binding protein n=1 Tax=Papaver nudicaule TaxID=74823 RepID=A0AA41VAI1_PAPNU|nr:hypothetical protein [Papaver nudicaule]
MESLLSCDCTSVYSCRFHRGVYDGQDVAGNTTKHPTKTDQPFLLIYFLQFYVEQLGTLIDCVASFINSMDPDINTMDLDIKLKGLMEETCSYSLGQAIHVVLFDASTRRVVTSGPESSAKLDIVVLEGDFNNDDEEGWTRDDFEKHLVWIRSRKFRLGLKISSGFCEGVRIREAKTNAFTVKDHRGERLEIGKDGSFHKRLNKSGIYNVEQFLRYVVRDAQKLRNILGSGMSNKMWEVLVDHAKTCVLGGMLYVYYADDTRNVGVVFNNIYEFTGLISSGQYVSPDSVTESQKVNLLT